VVGRLFRFYFRNVLPWIGGLVSRDGEAYGYLPESVEKFPPPQAMVELMRAAGFVEVSWTPYSFGIAGLWRGRKTFTTEDTEHTEN
jgi:demethylmenaquinone methyltransferase/2-methoxy-6-polyprenyl-1,4-benzoquinol methylase